jgi:hypothetical protein
MRPVDIRYSYGIAWRGKKLRAVFFAGSNLFQTGGVKTRAMQTKSGNKSGRVVALFSNDFKGTSLKHPERITRLTGFLLALMLALGAHAQQQPNAPLPDIRKLMLEVQDHQRQLDKVRETYTYSTLEKIEGIDSNGKVTKTETVEQEDFFVNGHLIDRTVKKNGQPLSEHDRQKDADRVTKQVEKAEKTPPGQPLEGQTTTSISRLLEIMDVRNPRRDTYRGRRTIVFDFVGRKDAKTHGLVEDASKKLQGTVWIDDADRQVAHLEVSFTDNFHVAGGLLANVQKGSNFRFDQAPVSDGLWLPTGGEGTMQVRVLMVKNLRERFSEHDYDYKRFSVETQQAKDAKLVPEKKP